MKKTEEMTLRSLLCALRELNLSKIKPAGMRDRSKIRSRDECFVVVSLPLILAGLIVNESGARTRFTYHTSVKIGHTLDSFPCPVYALSSFDVKLHQNVPSAKKNCSDLFRKSSLKWKKFVLI